MFDLDVDLNELFEKNRIDKIREFFNKPAIEPQPKMARKKTYSNKDRNLENKEMDLDNDIMIYRDNNYLVTKWNTVNPKPEFSRGISFYLIENDKEGNIKGNIKISAIFDENGVLFKYYCEVVKVDYKKADDKYVFTDLIVDVNVNKEKNGDIKFAVVDEDELDIAVRERKTVTQEEKNKILEVKDKILRLINACEIPPKECIRRVEKSK